MTHSLPQNDGLNLSFVKDINVVAKKWPKMVVKWPFMSCKFPDFFLKKLKINGNKKIVIFVVAFNPIRILTCWDLQSTVRTSVL